jgi:hypothetical protein
MLPQKARKAVASGDLGSAGGLPMKIVTLAVVSLAMACSAASAEANAEAAKRCLRAAYLMYPYKRPGAVPMSGDRLSYFNDCMARQKNLVPDPEK